jgi:SAM-dependent methyltransferase
MWEKRIRRVEEFVNGGRVLDVGAGTGEFLHGLSRSGRWQTDGTEISSRAVELAMRNHEIDLRLGAVADVNLPPDHFDLITLWHVLEHVPDVQGTLATVVAALKPGGIVFIAVPNDSLSVRVPLVMARDLVRRSGRSGLQMMMGSPMFGDEIHLQHFSQRSLIRAVRRAGLTICHLDVDDHYSRPTRKTNLKVRIGAAIQRLTQVNCFPTVLLVAERRDRRPAAI